MPVEQARVQVQLACGYIDHEQATVLKEHLLLTNQMGAYLATAA